MVYAAAYIQLEKRFFNKLTITGGVRFEFAMLDTSVVKYPFYAIKRKGKLPKAL